VGHHVHHKSRQKTDIQHADDTKQHKKGRRKHQMRQPVQPRPTISNQKTTSSLRSSILQRQVQDFRPFTPYCCGTQDQQRKRQKHYESWKSRKLHQSCTRLSHRKQPLGHAFRHNIHVGVQPGSRLTCSAIVPRVALALPIVAEGVLEDTAVAILLLENSIRTSFQCKPECWLFGERLPHRTFASTILVNELDALW